MLSSGSEAGHGTMSRDYSQSWDSGDRDTARDQDICSDYIEVSNQPIIRDCHLYVLHLMVTLSGGDDSNTSVCSIRSVGTSGPPTKEAHDTAVENEIASSHELK